MEVNEFRERSGWDGERGDLPTGDSSKRFATMTLSSMRRVASMSGGESKEGHLRHAPSLSFTSSSSSGNVFQSEGSSSQPSQTSSGKVQFAPATVMATPKASGPPRRPLPPAPLAMLPSENLARSSSVRTARRTKTPSITSATVRGSTMFPSVSASSNPTTAVTTTPASPERPRNLQRTLSRTSAAALAGLQEQLGRDERKRTNSAGEGVDNDAHTNLVESNRRTLGSRPRMSLDGRAAEVNFTTMARRERRGTVVGLFSRS